MASGNEQIWRHALAPRAATVATLERSVLDYHWNYLKDRKEAVRHLWKHRGLG